MSQVFAAACYGSRKSDQSSYIVGVFSTQESAEQGCQADAREESGASAPQLRWSAGEAEAPGAMTYAIVACKVDELA